MELSLLETLFLGVWSFLLFSSAAESTNCTRWWWNITYTRGIMKFHLYSFFLGTNILPLRSYIRVFWRTFFWLYKNFRECLAWVAFLRWVPKFASLLQNIDVKISASVEIWGLVGTYEAWSLWLGLHVKHVLININRALETQIYNIYQTYTWLGTYTLAS